MMLRSVSTESWPEKARKHDCFLFCVNMDEWQKHSDRFYKSSLTVIRCKISVVVLEEYNISSCADTFTQINVTGV